MTIGFIQEPVRNEKVLISTTSKVIAEARNELAPRKVILIRNISTDINNEITINLGLTTATAETGIILKQGESFSDSSEGGYTAFNGTITAISNNANGAVAILER